MFISDQPLKGYCCICTTAFSRKDESRIIKSKAYKKILDFFENTLCVPSSDIRCDVLVNSSRKRIEFINLIDDIKHGSHRYHQLRGVIVIYDLTALGATPSDAYENYMTILNEHIGLYIISESHNKYSSVNLFHEFAWDPWEIEERAIKIKKLKFGTNKGRTKHTPAITEEFKTVYWAYEHYHIPESMAYDNKLNGKIARMAFKRACDAYEKSSEYEIDEDKQNRLPVRGDIPIGLKPKRHGKATAEILEAVEMYSKGELSAEGAAKQLNMTPTTFLRFCRKGEGRKAMAQASYIYGNNEEAIRIIQSEKNGRD